nr:potassium channel family protein [Lentibacillus saliphilus]
MTISSLKQVYFKIPKIIRLLCAVLVLLTIFGACIHYIEPNQFKTIFDGVWWAFVTGATVGYGDFVPLSTTGRLLGIAIILSGGGLLAYYVSTLSATAIDRQTNKTHGHISFRGTGHIVFIGWNERTRQLIDMITVKNPPFKIVLIDQTLMERPKNYPHIHFIQGNPTMDTTLEKAHISAARRVLVTANTSESESHADNMTILTTLAVRGNHRDVPIVVEILTDNHIENATRAGANTIIRPNDFLSTLLYHELIHTPKTTPFENILQLLNHQHFEQISLSDPEQYSDFREAAKAYLNQDRILFGVIRDNQWIIHPKHSFAFKQHDILLLLTHWPKPNQPIY